LILSKDDILELIKQPKNKVAIAESVRMESELNALANGENIGIILNKYAALHTPELYNVIVGMFKMQAKSFLAVDGGAVFSHFQKIFNTQETENIQYSFGDVNELASFIEYIQSCYVANQDTKGISSYEFYREVLLQESLYYPNSRLIIDFPNENTTETKPYVSLVKINDIHDIEELKSGVAYVIVKEFYKKDKQGNIKKVAESKGFDYVDYKVYDSEKYALWRRYNYQSEPAEISVTPHNFGYCPAVSVSGYNNSANTSVIKKSQLLDSLPDIEHYTFVKNAANYYQLQKGSPASVGIANECDFQFECGTICTQGFIDYPITENNSILDTFSTINSTNGKLRFRRSICPKCARRKEEKYHLGKQVDIKYPHIFQANGEVKEKILEVVKSSLGSIPSDTNFLEFSQNWLARMEAKIKADITGEGFNMAQSKENFNKEYLSLSTDDKQNNLSVFAGKIEKIQEFIESSIAKARYLTFENIYVDYGRQYFLKTANEYQTEVTDLVNKSGDVFTILQKINQLQKSQNSGNYLLQVLGKIITSVVPHTDMTKLQVIQNKANIVTNETEYLNYLIRVYAVNWIQEFMLLYQNSMFSNGTIRTLHKRFADFMYEKAAAMQQNNITYFYKNFKTEIENGKASNTTNGNDNPNGQPNTGE